MINLRCSDCLVSESSDRQRRLFSAFEDKKLYWLFKDDKSNDPPYIELEARGSYVVNNYTFESTIDIRYYSEKSGSKRLEELRVERGDGLDDEL